VSASAAIDVSVVIPAYKRLGFLTRTIESVLSQGFDGIFELIVVASADNADELEPFANASNDMRLTMIRHSGRLSASRARNLGAKRANGAAIAFTDADVLTLPGWLRALSRASDGDRFCVAGSVVNGTPGSLIGTAEYIAEFVDLHPSRPPEHAWHGALCNLYVPKDLWDRFGPFPEHMLAGEDTAFTTLLRANGLFAFEPKARIAHMNRTDFSAVMIHHFFMGKSAAELGRVSPHYKYRALVRYTILAPVAALGRVASVYARAFAWMKGERLRAGLGFPVVVAALMSWGGGLFIRGLQLDRRKRSG
jgi:glycosyltransferase involved in cell wall biosynthesis